MTNDTYREIEASKRATQCRGCSRNIILATDDLIRTTETSFLRCFAEPIGPSFLLCAECAKQALTALDDMSYEQTIEDHAVQHKARVARSDLYVSPDDTLEELEAKHAEAHRQCAEAKKTSDEMSTLREQLRVSIAIKRHTCLCATERHKSCQQRRPWCLVGDCLCDTCRTKIRQVPLSQRCRSCGRRDGTHEENCLAQRVARQRQEQAECDHRSDYGTRRTTGDPPGPDCCGRCGLELPHVEI